MFTYTQLYKRAADIIGIQSGISSVALSNLQADINQALRLFKNQSRRYWSRKQAVADLVANQQYYTFPQDMVRITTAMVNSGTGSLSIPLLIVDSEELWNKINLVPGMTVGMSTTGFIRGRNELGLYPIPASNITGGLVVSYEPRLRDMSIEDTNAASVTLTHNSVNVTAGGSVFNANMVGMTLQGGDGYWYTITGYTSGTQITIENVYQGATVTQTTLIGHVPDIPEDYHLGLVYYAAYNYFLKRKDQATAAGYKALFEDLIQQYKKVYAEKTTGLTQNDIVPYSYNLFMLPPINVTG